MYGSLKKFEHVLVLVIKQRKHLTVADALPCPVPARCGASEPGPGVPAQMWRGRASSVPARMWQGEPSLGADEAKMSPPAQMRRELASPGTDVAGASPVLVQMCHHQGGAVCSTCRHPPANQYRHILPSQGIGMHTARAATRTGHLRRRNDPTRQANQNGRTGRASQLSPNDGQARRLMSIPYKIGEGTHRLEPSVRVPREARDGRAVVHAVAILSGEVAPDISAGQAGVGTELRVAGWVVVLVVLCTRTEVRVRSSRSSRSREHSGHERLTTQNRKGSRVVHGNPNGFVALTTEPMN